MQQLDPALGSEIYGPALQNEAKARIPRLEDMLLG